MSPSSLGFILWILLPKVYVLNRLPYSSLDYSKFQLLLTASITLLATRVSFSTAWYAIWRSEHFHETSLNGSIGSSSTRLAHETCFVGNSLFTSVLKNQCCMRSAACKMAVRNYQIRKIGTYLIQIEKRWFVVFELHTQTKQLTVRINVWALLPSINSRASSSPRLKKSWEFPFIHNFVPQLNGVLGFWGFGVLVRH